MTIKITKLVLSGGSMRGFSFLSLLKYLEKKDTLKDINEFVGTSIGALVGMLIILGYLAKELQDFFLDIEFDIEKDICLGNFFELYGLNDGKFIDKLIRGLIKMKGYIPDITLKELYTKTNKILVACACCVNTKSPVFFNHINYPDMPVWLAVRASMSIPFIFTPVIYQDNYYIDGGGVVNLPIKYYTESETVIKSEILCVSLKEIIPLEKRHICIDTIDKYYINALKSSFDRIEYDDLEYIKKNGYLLLTLNVKISNSLDFKLSKEERLEIINSSYITVKDFFKNLNKN
jgi:NTE family protein